MAVLPKGANAPLPTQAVDAVLEWTDTNGVSHDIDLCGLVLGGDGKVREDSDFIFYNQPSHPSGAVTHQGRAGSAERLSIDLEQLPEDADKVLLVGAISDGTFGAVQDLALTVSDPVNPGDELRFEAMGASTETAFVVAELYRRNGTWKFRAVGQGWEGGLASLATNFGVSIAASEGETAAVDQAPTELSSIASPGGQVPTQSTVAPQGVVEASPSDSSLGTSEARTSPAAASSPRRRTLPAAVVRPGTPTLDEEGTVLAIGQSVSLLRRGSSPSNLWLRVTHVADDLRHGLDLSALCYDEFGCPAGVAFFADSTVCGSTVLLLNKPTTNDPADTAAVELKLSAIGPEVAGVVLAATSYQGRPVSEAGALVTEIVGPDGMVHARCETPTSTGTGILLVALKRDPSGAWLLTHSGVTTTGRTGLSLVGAGHWALIA